VVLKSFSFYDLRMDHRGYVSSSTKGQAALLLVSGLCLVGIIVLMSSLDIFVRNYNYKAKDFNQVLLDETTSSSFAVMEAALERRLWEPPPDSNCMKSDTFSVSGSFTGGVSWNVDAHFNTDTKNYELTATGSYKGLTSLFKKKIKVMDVSDYLVLSTGPNDIYLDRLYAQQQPSALIARDRRIYTKGALRVGANLDRPNSKTNFNGSPALWPAEWGSIVQGDRMQFAGGIYYTPYGVQEPNPEPAPSNIQTLLAPYTAPFGSAVTHFGQFGAGSAVITKDFTKASTLKDQVIAGAAGPLTRASLQSEVYPIALFSGTPPLKSWTATDNGTYFNDLDRYSIFYYGYGSDNHYGIRVDTTCLSKVNAWDKKKLCSHSEHFPKGFSKWRTNAGLDGYLYTADAVAVPSPTLSWDNLAALEDDAKTCGAVVSAPVSSYTDCPMWDQGFINSYASTGATTGCQEVSSIDLDSLSLANFNASAINDPANKDRLLRRIVYLKGPAEIKQAAAQGLMLSSVSDNVTRKNMSLWIVSEDMLALRGYQADTTSPLDSDPGRIREINFNADVSGVPAASQKTPLNIILMSSEKIHLLSPFYVPLTPAHLSTFWPVSGGKIRPIRHNLTDFDRYENDGFKYGYRRFNVNNASLVLSSKSNAVNSQPFYLRGLWSGPDSSANQYPSNQCMVSLAGNVLTKDPSSGFYQTAQIPAYYSVANSPIPPPSSHYYNGLNRFPAKYVPEVFNVQQAAPENAGRSQSEVVLNGINISTEFATGTASGKRDLSVPLYTPVDDRGYNGSGMDLGHKNYTWDVDIYYNQRPSGTACVLTNVENRVYTNPLNHYDSYGVNPSVNNGSQTYVQISPSVDYRQLGAVVGVDQLVIETKADH
jgi:hypothetical protein